MSSIELSDQSPRARVALDGVDTDVPRNEVALPPVDHGFRAWSFLLAAFLVETCVWGLPSTYGVFLAYYMSDPEYAAQKNASSLLPLVGTLSSGINYCSGPVLYPVLSRYPSTRRGMTWLGALILSASLLASSYVWQASLLLLLQGAMYAIGGSLLYAPIVALVPEWFYERRGFANGVVFAGASVGGLFLPSLLPVFIKTWGVAPTLRILSISIFIVLVASLPFIRGRLPDARARIRAPRSVDRKYLRTPLFWVFVTMNLLQALAFFVPILWLPSFAISMNLNSTQSSLAVAMLNGAAVVGRLGLGVCSDRYNVWLLALLTLSSASGIVFIFWGILAYNIGGLVTFGLAYGMVAGGWSSLSSGFARPIAKDDSALTTTIFGFFTLSRGIGYILSTPISTALTGFAVGGGKYEQMIIYVGTCFAGAAMMSLVGWTVTQNGRQ